MSSWSLNYRTDNIKLGKKIGSGAQAEIFKATCGLDDVAVKRFLNSRHRSTKQEIDIIKKLTHRHIVQFYHVQHDMLVMEYVEGGSLADAIVGRGLKSWEVKTQIAKDVSLGLAYLHCQGIIHCDIKSSNILLTEHKEARICDFGFAMRVGESGGGGTLQWMAPELLQNPPEYTEKSDVYALGMVMWEMAYESTQPYREHTPDGMMYCILHGILEEYPNDTPKAYAACIRMCWILTPEERPAAVDVLPHVGCLSHREGTQDPRGARINDEKVHYLKALKQYFKTSESAGFMDIVKNDDMLQDNDKTMDWFESSAGGSESAKAMFKMGTMYYDGRSMEQDYGKALEWFLAASEAGIAVAMLKISQMYQHGRGVEQDDNEAASWYCRAEHAVNVQGKLNNRIIHHDSGVSEHHTRTMEWFRDTVGVGPAVDTCNIGHMYYYGQDLELDYSKALEWYLKASDAGNSNAMSNVGVIYSNGQGVGRNYGMAMKWFLKASDAGNATAKHNIGIMYDNGLGIKQDYNRAMEWCLKASNAGNATAMFNVGVMYRHGQGVQQHFGKAMEWYLKASDAGNASAMGNIGFMYDDGLGVKQDSGKALEWFRKAHEAGNAIAKRKLGSMYDNGQGIKLECGVAMRLQSVAATAGAISDIGFMNNSGLGVEQMVNCSDGTRAKPLECTRSHSPRHQCPRCELYFASPAVLVRHIESIHDKLLWNCVGCKSNLSRRDAVTRHINLSPVDSICRLVGTIGQIKMLNGCEIHYEISSYRAKPLDEVMSRMGKTISTALRRDIDRSKAAMMQREAAVSAASAAIGAAAVAASSSTSGSGSSTTSTLNDQMRTMTMMSVPEDMMSEGEGCYIDYGSSMKRRRSVDDDADRKRQ